MVNRAGGSVVRDGCFPEKSSVSTVSVVRSVPFLCSVCLLVTAVSGCGGGSEAPAYAEKLVPATGQVTLNGEPLSRVMVAFRPAEGSSGEVAIGITAQDGTYSLHTPTVGQSAEESQGAVPGEYRVTITKLVMPDGSDVPPDTTDADAEALGAVQLLPPKYSDLTGTTLTATVEAGSAENNFPLVDE